MTRPTNITLLYIIKFSKWLMLIMPIIALYYTENGLSSYHIYLLQAVYSISVAVMEIPSGYMADVIGRKKSLILGAILGTVGFVIYAGAEGFAAFMVAEIILGLGGSFISGSDSALLYDSLIAEDREADYLRYEGRITSFGSFAETVAALAGGMLALWLGYRGVYWVQAFVAATAIPASLLLVEPPHRNIERPSIRQILCICHESLFINKQLAIAILLSSVTGTATLCMAWTSQVYFVYHGLDERTITPIWIALNLCVALVSAFSYRAIAFLGYKKAIVSIMVLIPSAYMVLGWLPLVGGLLVLLLFYALRGYATPLLKDITNRFCASQVRATVLSIRSLLIRGSFSLLGPCIGYSSQKLSLPMALSLAGLVLLISSLIVGTIFLKRIPQA